MKNIGIGKIDFKEMRENDYYYIDKTMYIKDIIDNGCVAILVTRPSGFGKSLNLSMLKYYFDIREKESKKLFENLKIMDQEEKYIKKMNSYPLIYLSFENVIGNTYDEIIMEMKNEISKLYKQHKFLLESNTLRDFEKEEANRVLENNEDISTLLNSVKDLISWLYEYYGKYVMVLLDDYNKPIKNICSDDERKKVADFLDRFFNITFKDNAHMEKVVLAGETGWTYVSNIYYGVANHFCTYSVLDKKYTDDFGITSKEMEKVISDFNIEEDREEIKKWYDGYKIGNVEGIYNPWSILNYLADRVLKPYWVNTSSNDLIKMTFKKSNIVKEKMIKLLNDEPVEVKIDLETIIVGIENKEENIWGLMLQTGYLKVVETVDLIRGIYKVVLPNNEIKFLFEDMVDNWFSNKVEGEDLRSILNDLVNLKLEDFERKLKKLVIEMFSYFDVGENTAESFYHAFILGMLVGLKDSYYVKSNRESGHGRYDIMLEPKEKESNSFIMEFKIAKEMEEKEVKAKIKEAKEQIKDKKYEQELKERGFTNITKMVFVCNGKEIRVDVFN